MSKGPVDVPVISSYYDGNTVKTAISPQEIKELLEHGGLALLKGAFPQDLLRDVLDGVFTWGQEREPQRESEVSYHRIDERPPQSQTSHMFHIHNFRLLPGAIDAEMDRLIRPIFTAMGDLQNVVAGTQGGFEPNAAGISFRPQVIQYPRGGGFFNEHVHPIEPQRVGLILGLSEKGIDFKEGGTSFRIEDTEYSFDGNHAMGDIILFRYNLPHWITPVDQNESLNWAHQAGRWTMVMPYY